MPLSRDDRGDAVLGGVSLATVLDRRDVTTPFYAYDLDAVAASAAAVRDAFGKHDALVCYAVKANAAGRIVRRLAADGVGADVVSGGELAVALGAGVPASRVVWSGVAKTDDELDLAIASGLLSVHAESVEELHRVAARALSANRVARVSLRLNPGVEADTHAHIATGHDEAKFGIPMADLAAALDAARAPGLALVGLSSHVGSQMTTTDAYTDGARAICEAAHAAITAGFPLELLDLGGGMGIDYGDGCPSAPADFVRAAAAIVRDAGLGHLRLLCEPGRALVGAHGVLVARVIQTKRWRRPDTLGWVLLDAGMNDLVRPAMYGARHRIEPLRTTAGAPDGRWRVAGPVCESSDDFGTFELPDPPPPAVVIRDAGAYGFAMASQYNGRALATEVFLENGAVSAVSPGATVAAWVAARLAT